MVNLTTISTPTKLVTWLIVAGGMALWLCFMLPAVALADSPEDCASCHSEETMDWRKSPHAKAESGSVACESCHGDYVEGHPNAGVMPLEVDSAVCQDCHQETAEQWQNSLHGQANVQCISCHQSHSQEFRKADEALCVSCHRDQLDDFSHSIHTEANLVCTDCHTSAESSGSTASLAKSAPAANHSFGVTSKACVDCHERSHADSSFQSIDQPSDGPGRTEELATQLKAIEQANLSLKGLSVAGLGLGLGIGGMVGIILMLVMSRLGQRSAKL
jgi:nitrate/TMAO reductase-like tetraheme cytochrome c subunit